MLQTVHEIVRRFTAAPPPTGQGLVTVVPIAEATTRELELLYGAWLIDNSLPPLEPDELVSSRRLHADQLLWLVSFVQEYAAAVQRRTLTVDLRAEVLS